MLFVLARRACVAYIWSEFKCAFICIPNTVRHIRIFCLTRNTMTFLVYIENQNLTRIHIEKRILQMLLPFQQSNYLWIWLTFWLLLQRHYNHTGTKSIHVIASIKCGNWNTTRIFWIDLILVLFWKFRLSKQVTALHITNNSSRECINVL